MKRRAILADDEPNLLAHLDERLTVLWPELHIVGHAKNGLEASALIENVQPDIAFLDIKMPGRSGVEVAQGIEGATRVVFVTAYDEFATQAFDEEAIDYVLKPISDERLLRTIARAERALGGNEMPQDLMRLMQRFSTHVRAATPLRWLRASKGETTYQVPVESIVLFQSNDKYTAFFTEDGAEYLIRTPVAELLRGLDAELFWQVHRGTIVNATKVVSSRRDELGKMLLTLRDHDNPVAVSQAYRGLFKSQ
jgi:DNA-binding LytR/AlgR family response regulator